MRKFIPIVIGLLIFTVYVISSMPVQGLENWCESKSGKWSEHSNFCSVGDGFSCTISGGKYVDCDSRFVDENGNLVESPMAVCRHTCQFN